MARILARMRTTQKTQVTFNNQGMSDVIDVFGPAIVTNAPAFIRQGP
jgi:hypothetical protein